MRSPRWLHGPGLDSALALSWVPVALAVVASQHHPAAVRTLLDAVLVLSLSHQPVTLALVYGDRERFTEHRKVFALAPVVAVIAVLFALHVSFVLVAVAAGLWNAEHTLMQRYGVTRMYGRKAGDERGDMEKPMLCSWLIAAVLAAAANPNTPRSLRQVDVGDVNKRAITLLTSFRVEAAVLLLPAALVAVVLTARWVQAERHDPKANPAKWLYAAATAALILLICVDPIAGFAAYVGAHAVEYFVIVRAAAGRRAGTGGGGAVGVAIRSRLGATGFVALAAGSAAIPLVVLGRVGTFTIVTATYLSVGALHILYDGLIWKMRRPSVARDLAVSAA